MYKPKASLNLQLIQGCIFYIPYLLTVIKNIIRANKKYLIMHYFHEKLR